jgi:hypothetical protein
VDSANRRWSPRSSECGDGSQDPRGITLRRGAFAVERPAASPDPSGSASAGPRRPCWLRPALVAASACGWKHPAESEARCLRVRADRSVVAGSWLRSRPAAASPSDLARTASAGALARNLRFGGTWSFGLKRLHGRVLHAAHLRLASGSNRIVLRHGSADSRLCQAKAQGSIERRLVATRVGDNGLSGGAKP